MPKTSVQHARNNIFMTIGISWRLFIFAFSKTIIALRFWQLRVEKNVGNDHMSCLLLNTNFVLAATPTMASSNGKHASLLKDTHLI
jgi:hypothetical protein